MSQRDLLRRGILPKKEQYVEKEGPRKKEELQPPFSPLPIQQIEVVGKGKKKFRDYGGKRNRGYPSVAWVHDTQKYGGAELSNQRVIEVGRELGFEIYECHPGTFDKKKLGDADFLILNNFFFFPQDQYHFILDLLFEYGRPFAKYEHDHREVYGSTARIKMARLLFGRSFLNIFISPFQIVNHRRKLGELIEPHFLLPPAIDTEKFRILPEIKRDESKVVSMTGRLYHSKGLAHISNFVHVKPKLKFEIYSKEPGKVREYFKDVKNVEIFSPVEYEELPRIYNSAGYSIHLPQEFEACGRTIAEGVLCGCKPLYNKNVGIGSFKYFHLGDKNLFDYERFREACRIGPYFFWKNIDVCFHGYVPRKRYWELFEELGEKMRRSIKLTRQKREKNANNL